ncbi:hypothetical protein LOK49_LG05G00360 [Camellia lanceoleosa]|uniref:Uncharacterized protein n=1 Tax=Camellia lanceoleosa TaxID=1840588 RepID=A0ACC0HRI4_9ERIC|nr:hypothetical protein LOK49_LG05G00360 [Camellia lanceoleosa]
MELEHFSHDHPLILYTELMYDGDDDDGVAKISCYACEQLIISCQSYYGCNRCWFFLHKSCAELPKKITHPSHLEHPLALFSNPTYNSGCDFCGESCNRFIYQCSPCKFDVHLKCASVAYSIQKRIEHKSHTQHQLISLQKPAMFFCDACGTKHEGTSYLCTTCGFWVNQHCADSLPSTIKLTNHPHPLTLIYSMPFEYDGPWANCAICGEQVYRRNWVYYCSDSECKYFVHVNCATSETERYIEYKSELNLVDSGITTSNTKLSRECKADTKGEIFDPNLINLPMPNEFDDLVTQFIKGIRLQGMYEGATKIQHGSHRHPLIFFDKQLDSESCSTGNKLPLLNEVMKNDKKCKGCARTISAPFFYCAKCNFFLHEWCAELPIELRHPCHPEHPLLLTKKFHLFGCTCCGSDSISFIFRCTTCEYSIDCKCASLPRIIRHKAHKHTLALRQTWSARCSACNDVYHRCAFVCDPCNLNICVGCAVLPDTVSHRYDKHPFTLTYSPPLKDPNVDEEYYCEICEGEINPKLWFYHCQMTDQSLHTLCIRPIDWNPNVKRIEFHHHHPHHLLRRAQIPKENSAIQSPCSQCGEYFRNDSHMYYECPRCSFFLYRCSFSK